MTMLLAGLFLFLGVHSVRIFAEDWHQRRIARAGEAAWKIGYSLISLAGLVLIVWGYGLARADPSAITLWNPPQWTRHVASLLTLPAFILVAAAYVPGTRIKAAIGHPMIVGVKLWALAHLIANGRMADLVLFGAFLLWAVFDFRAARVRDRITGVRRAAVGISRDLIATAIGLVLWAAFAFHLHAWLIGVRPFA
jgi:uncharacterized membrane protein